MGDVNYSFDGTQVIDVGEEPLPPEGYRMSNPDVTPAYERFLATLKSLGWATEDGKAKDFPLVGSSWLEFNERTKRYDFVLCCRRRCVS